MLRPVLCMTFLNSHVTRAISKFAERRGIFGNSGEISRFKSLFLQRVCWLPRVLGLLLRVEMKGQFVGVGACSKVNLVTHIVPGYKREKVY